MKRTASFWRAVIVALSCVAAASADTIIDMVTILNPGNTGEMSGSSVPGGNGPDRVCGAVDHVYQIGKYEITAGQYTEFLNALVKSDPYGLYTEDMWSSEKGCKIQRLNLSGNYAYSVDASYADRPVNYVSWGNAARFCNWMHNGQPNGTLTGNPILDAAFTEDGSYALNGEIYNLMGVTRKPNATWVIPNEDEWYKAAYHKNDGDTGNYWKYPTRSNDEPDNGYPGGDTGNSANFFDGSDYTSPVFWRTTAGFFTQSWSPYGTFDQGGNVYEWNETVVDSNSRGLRGGYFDFRSYPLQASWRGGSAPWEQSYGRGFRVGYVPEPATLTLLGFVLLISLRRR